MRQASGRDPTASRSAELRASSNGNASMAPGRRPEDFMTHESMLSKCVTWCNCRYTDTMAAMPIAKNKKSAHCPLAIRSHRAPTNSAASKPNKYTDLIQAVPQNGTIPKENWAIGMKIKMATSTDAQCHSVGSRSLNSKIAAPTTVNTTDTQASLWK